MTLEIEAGVMGAMRAHAEEGFPDEVCGAVLATPEGQVVRRMTNIQNRLHAADPGAHPRDATIAYEPDPRELFELHRETRRDGWAILAFYHSHPKHGAYFSETDRARALSQFPGEPPEPLYPGVAWVVLSVYDRAVRDAKAFAWDAGAADFVEVAIRVGD
jgi:proteasome lid subunit RPN8/RPN11